MRMWRYLILIGFAFFCVFVSLFVCLFVSFLVGCDKSYDLFE